MTRKDFELIASAMNYGQTIPADDNQLYWTIDFLANKLQATNPKFDRERFLEACGVESV